MKKNNDCKLSDDRLDRLKEFEREHLNYQFKNINLLNTALTHSSYANESIEKGIQHNERLEFLGDSILDLIVSEELFKNHSDYPEGKLTKLRSQIVCESSFAKAATSLNLSSYLLLGRGEYQQKGYEKASVKADAFEAVMAAVYLDAGYNFLKQFVIDRFKDQVLNLLEKKQIFIDYKTRLQEYYNKKKNCMLVYEIVNETGPDHNKTFYVSVRLKNRKLAVGKGKSKKSAEQMAAKKVLEGLHA